MGTEVPDPVSMTPLANKNPELFALVDLCQNKDTELLQRMLSYCNLLINS